MSLIIIQIRVEKIMTSENLLTKIRNNKGTLLRTVIYTIGHFFIAAACVMYFTGASFDAAITDAIVEPLINGVWYFLLDKFWASKITNNKENLAIY
jgi:uncharacterized membrane protein